MTKKRAKAVQSAKHLEKKAQTALRGAKKKFVAAERKVRSEIRKNPRRAALIGAAVAAAVGVAVARAVKRRAKSRRK